MSQKLSGIIYPMCIYSNLICNNAVPEIRKTARSGHENRMVYRSISVHARKREEGFTPDR
jgi:hypothetical protein